MSCFCSCYAIIFSRCTWNIHVYISKYILIHNRVYKFCGVVQSTKINAFYTGKLLRNPLCQTLTQSQEIGTKFLFPRLMIMNIFHDVFNSVISYRVIFYTYSPKSIQIISVMHLYGELGFVVKSAMVSVVSMQLVTITKNS